MARKLGEGNYGIVVKGTLLERSHDNSTYSRQPVAIKMLKSWNTVQAKALLSELKILTYVGKHNNVVSLVGAITDFENYEERKNKSFYAQTCILNCSSWKY